MCVCVRVCVHVCVCVCVCVCVRVCVQVCLASQMFENVPKTIKIAMRQNRVGAKSAVKGG